MSGLATRLLKVTGRGRTEGLTALRMELGNRFAKSPRKPKEAKTA